MMLRRLGTGSMLVLALAACTRTVELPIDRRDAELQRLTDGRCPSATVAYADDDPRSGAGAVPDDFALTGVLRCYVDHTSTASQDETVTLRVTQWSAPSTPELRGAFELPDREQRPRRGCAAGKAGDTAVYVVDDAQRAVRVQLPRDEPCSVIREEVARLLPDSEQPPEQTFEVAYPDR